MEQDYNNMKADNENLINQVAELREALKDIMRYNCQGKTKKIHDRAEIVLGYRNK